MNPITSMLGAMNQQQNTGLMQIMSVLRSGNPEQAAWQIINGNPALKQRMEQMANSSEFKRFAEANKGKSIEQIAKENGIF